jgi:hypothetical protein
MKKIIKLRESELISLITKVINEGETSEGVSYTKQTIRLEAVSLLRNLGIKVTEDSVNETVKMLSRLINEFGNGRIFN